MGFRLLLTNANKDAKTGEEHGESIKAEVAPKANGSNNQGTFNCFLILVKSTVFVKENGIISKTFKPIQIVNTDVSNIAISLIEKYAENVSKLIKKWYFP